MRGALRAIVAAFAIAAIAGVATPARGATVEVLVRDFRFDPVEITVDTGDTVRWRQIGNAPHTVTADDGSFDSHPNCQPLCMQQGDVFDQPFNTPGTSLYYCKVHGAKGGQGMAGRIVVRAPASTTTPSASPQGQSATTTTAAASDGAAGTPAATGVGASGPSDLSAAALGTPAAVQGEQIVRQDQVVGPSSSALPTTGAEGARSVAGIMLLGLAGAIKIASTRRAETAPPA